MARGLKISGNVVISIMRFLLALVFLTVVSAAESSELLLKDGTIVNGSLVIFSNQGARVITHGATPDQYFTWDQIADEGLREQEVLAKREFLQKQEENRPTLHTKGRDVATETDSLPTDEAIESTEWAANAVEEYSAGSSESTFSTAKLPKEARKRKVGEVPLPDFAAKIEAIKGHPLLDLRRYFGIYQMGAYLLLVLLAVGVNFTARKKVTWSEKPKAIPKAINVAFGASLLLGVAAVAGSFFRVPASGDFGSERLATIAMSLFLSLIASIGIKAKNRVLTFLYLAAVVAGNAFFLRQANYTGEWGPIGMTFVLACLYTFLIVDAFFAMLHYHSARKAEALGKSIQEAKLARSVA